MTQLRVASYNIHSCVGSDGRYDPERVISVIRDIDPDVIAIQEIGGYLADGMEQVAYFEAKLGMHAITGPNLVRRRVQFGNAIFVRGQARSVERINLTVKRREPRGAIDAVVETRHGSLRVVATHLGLFPRERRRQIAMLCHVLEHRPQPLTVLLGDFNIFGPERIALYRIGAPRPLPKLYTFPARRPFMSLDRMWTIPNERLVKLGVHRTPLTQYASDHLPLVGEIDTAAPIYVTAPGLRKIFA